MSNGDPYWDDAPASQGAQPVDDVASVVTRALSVLREHSDRAPAASASDGWTLDPSRPGTSGFRGFDPTTLLGARELIKQLEHIRDQTQDFIDTLVRVVESLPTGTAAGTSPVGTAAPSPDVASGTLSGLPQLRHVVAVAGQAGSTQLRLVNDARHPVEVLMKASSLIGPKGFEIPGHYVGFAPNPLVIGASASQPVDVTVRVPEHVPPGMYSGLVQGVGLDGASARLPIEVKPGGKAGYET